MKRLALVVSLVIAGTGAAGARRIYRPPPPPPTVDVGAELGAAIRAKSASRVAKLLGDTIHNYGIWFTDPACAKQFGAPGVVTGADLQPFARCLAQLRLQATTRQPGSSDDAILTYEPGVELELEHSGGRVRWIGFEHQTAADRGRPTLTLQAFEALRRTGKLNVDEAVAGKLDPLLDRAKLTSVSAWMKLCIDEEGALDQVTLRQSDAPAAHTAKVSTAFEVAMRSWRFRPFEARGKAMAVCTMALLTYPSARAPLVDTLPPAARPSFSIGEDKAPKTVMVVEKVVDVDEEGVEGDEVGGVLGGVVGGAPPPPPPPPPPAPPQNVAPAVLEGSRIRGDKNIVPADPTKIEIARSGKDRLIGSFKLCLDAQGAVSLVTQLKSTGFPDYDAKITREMRQWAYTPFLVNGTAVPVCTAVTFIYSQKPPAPPAPAPPAPAAPRK